VRLKDASPRHIRWRLYRKSGDLDDCLDPETGEIVGWAQEFI
jgi:hypothetical protein